MNVNNSDEYYLYEDDQPNSTEVKKVEQDNILKQLEETASSNKDNYPEEELNAAIGLMLLHHQSVSKAKLAQNNQQATQIEQQKQQRQLTNEPPTRRVPLETLMPHLRANRRSNYTKACLLASCRNILKEFLAQNDF